MSNILDYIDWRGDLTVQNAPFCEVDNLILSLFSYMDLADIAEGSSLRHSISLRDAVKQYFQKYGESGPNMGVLIPKEFPILYRKAAASRRFGNMRLMRYRSVLSDRIETQFSALCIAVGDGSFFVSYRGTDDTLIGWKENFNMSFMDSVPAQILARDYLTEAARHIRGRIRIGGHSKGGNLALYAAANASGRLQRRILNVYNNDGPGFGKSMAEHAGFAAIADRVITSVPHFSVVGLLLEHGKVDKVVQSSGEGLWQHDPCTWEIKRDAFVAEKDLSPESLRIERTIKAWVAELSPSERREFVEAVYKAFTANRAATLSDIAADKIDFIRSLGKLDGRMRDIILSTGKLLLREGIRVVQEDREKKSAKRQKKTDKTV